MIKQLLPLILTTLLFSSPIKTSEKIVPVDRAFSVESQSSLFNDEQTYTHQPLLSCQPELHAVYKIESSKKIKIIPKTPLQSGTHYRCKFKEESFSFQTEALKIVNIDYFNKEKVLRLSFNDNIDLTSLKENLMLTKVDKLSKTKLNYSIEESEQKNILLSINEPIEKNSLLLNINKNLSTTHNTTLEKDFTTQFDKKITKIVLDKEKRAMRIIDKPQMIALDTGEFAIRLFLSDTLGNNAKKSIEVKGIEEIKLSKNHYIDPKEREKYKLSEESYYYTDIISSEFQPNRNYTLTLKKGLKSYRELKEDKTYQVKSADRAKSILFDEGKSYISNLGELGFSSINVDKATLIVERLLDNNFRYFINFNHANINNVDLFTKEILSKNLTLNNQKNEILKQKFSLKELDKNLPLGVYKVSLRYDEVVEGKVEERFASKVLFLSDLGISLQLAKEQAFVTVLSLSSAQPIADAKVELYGENNELIVTATTNKDGVAMMQKKELLKAVPRGVVVTTSNDKNFLALNKTIDTPSPREILKNRERFKAHLYFQSNILRPASKLNALITVKDRDFISAKRLPVKLVLKELYGKTVQEKVYHTDEFGLIEFQHQFDNNDKTGNYTLDVFIGKEKIGSKILKVEAFMPPKIENSITTNQEIYQAGELIELNISSSYLFGAPSSGLNGSVQLHASAIDFSHEKFKNYSFTNKNLNKKNAQSYLENHASFTLDSNGEESLVLATKLTQKVPSILEALLNVTVMDDTHPVSSYKKVKIYPYKAMVGVKLNKNSFEKGQKLEGKALLIDPITGKIIERKLYAVLKRIRWQYDYSDGHYNWQKESKIIENFTLNSNETFSRNITENGDYVLEIHDRLGGHSASEEFDVWWWSYSNISPKNDLKSVEIHFKERLYTKGDSLAVTLKSPILEGQLFLTLESEKVELYRRLDLHKGVAKVTLPINIDMKRGLYLHATVIRASNTPSKLIPFRAMGYKFVKPNREEHKIKVTIEAPKTSKSQTSLALQIDTDKPAKVLVSIVDRGILQLVKQKKPEIFSYFNEPAKRGLSYYDLYDQLTSYIAEGNLLSFGAGDIAADIVEMREKHLAPDLGKRIKPFMLWSGIIDLSTKKRLINIDIPEFNGRAAIVAIAINQENIGVSEQEITIKDDVMLKPSYPKYALAGDTIHVPLRIFNTTKEPKIITLSSKHANNLSLTLTDNNLTIPPQSSKVVDTILYTNKVGKGAITLYATYGTETVSKSVELPIYNPYTISTKTFKGISNTKQSFNVPKAYHNAKVYINLSNNLIGALREDLNYVVHYPYGCAEQTSSALSAMHYAKAFLEKGSLVKESENFIRQGVKKLHNMQNYYGEFYYWENGKDVNAYASLYAAQTLLELQRDGTEISQNFVKKTITMLQNIAKEYGNYEGTYSQFHRLYAAFILAEHNALDRSTANMLFEQKVYKKHFLSTLYMAAILKMQGEESKADELYKKNSYLLSRYAIKPYGNRTGNFESNVRDMLLHFIVKTTYFDKDEKDLLTIQKEFSNLYSTQSKAVALKAISIYLDKPTNSKLNVNVTVNGKHENYKEPQIITLEKVKSSTIELLPKGSAMSYSIELVKHLPKAIKNSLSKKRVLSIMREFVDSKGEKVNIKHLKQGNKIYSKIYISNIGELNQVVINQRVPACFSIVNNNIHDTKATFKNKNIEVAYREIRDDRVLYFVNLKKKEKYDTITKKHTLLQNIGIVYTPLMVTTKGECQLPAVITEAMYDTRIHDYAKETEEIIVRED